MMRDPAPYADPGRARRAFDRAALLLFPLVSGAIAVARGQETTGDQLLYHFYGPYAFLHGRLATDVAAAGLGSFHNPLMYVPWYALTWALPAVSVGFVLGAVQGANGSLLYAIALRGAGEAGMLGRVVALAAAVAGWRCATNWNELGGTSFDNVASLAVLAAVLFAMRRRPGPDWAVGLLLGAAAGAKLTHSLYAVAFVPALLLSGASLRRVARVAAWIAVGFVALAGPVMIVLWREYRNPLFPYYNAVFHSPFFPDVNWRDTRWAFHGARAYLESPLAFVRGGARVFETPIFDARWLVLFPAALAGVASWRRLDAGARLLLPFVVGAYVVWAVQFAYLRYLVAAELLAPVAIAAVLLHIRRGSRAAALLAVAVSLGLAITTAVPVWGRVPWGRSWYEVDAPRLPRPGDAAIALEGLAFAAPFFQPEITWVGLDTNFFFVGGQDGALFERAVRVLREKVAYHLGIQGWSEDYSYGLYRSLGLMIDRERCLPVPTNVRPLELCPIVPFDPGARARSATARQGPPPIATQGGSIDVVEPSPGGVVLHGWAEWSGLRRTQALHVYTAGRAEVVRFEPVPRQDLPTVYPRRLLGWSGFRLELRGVAPDGPVCLQSEDPDLGLRELAGLARCTELRHAAASATPRAP